MLVKLGQCSPRKTAHNLECHAGSAERDTCLLENLVHLRISQESKREGCKEVEERQIMEGRDDYFLTAFEPISYFFKVPL